MIQGTATVLLWRAMQPDFLRDATRFMTAERSVDPSDAASFTLPARAASVSVQIAASPEFALQQLAAQAAHYAGRAPPRSPYPHSQEAWSPRPWRMPSTGFRWDLVSEGVGSCVRGFLSSQTISNG